METTPTYPPRTWRSVLRGLAAVAGLFLSALDALVTARIGIPRVAWCARWLGRTVATAYQLGRAGRPSACTDLQVLVYEFEVLDEEGDR
jgi:hypothetical protein